MKRVLYFLMTLVSVSASAQTMKMVVTTKGEVVGRHVSTNANTYTVVTQDDFNVKKVGHRVVTYSASAGQGVVLMKDFGKQKVYATPSTSGKVIAEIQYEEGNVPECYSCLGKVNGWYKIEIYETGEVGYVRAYFFEWDGMCTC